MKFSPNRLKLVRKNAGLTQQEVCDKLAPYGINIVRTTYQSYETGRFEPTVETAKVLAKILDSDPDYLYQNDLVGKITEKYDEDHDFPALLEYVKELPNDFDNISDDAKQLIKNCIDQALKIYKLSVKDNENT